MNVATRKKLLAYAIPVDLVIVATGVGFLVPGIQQLTLLAVFVGAVAISALKSGWGGALAAMLISSGLLLAFFSHTVQREQIGWFVAASIIATIPLAALHSRLRKKKEWIEAERRSEADAWAASPPDLPLPMTPGSKYLSPEEIAATVIGLGRPASEPIAPAKTPAPPPDEVPVKVPAVAPAEVIEETPTVIDKLHIVERETRARAEGERIAAERFAIEKRQLEEGFARTREQIDREHAERLERNRAELQAVYDRDRAALKAKFDAARLELDVERAELQKQLDEERRRPAVIEKHIDEDALAQRLEHLRAELQQQFERELQARIDSELAAQRKMLERDAVREIEKARRSADERIAAMRAEHERGLAERVAAAQQPQPRVRQAPPAAQAGIFRRLFSRQSDAQLKLNRRVISGESTATRRAAAAALAESSATRRANAARPGERKARVLFLESRRATADTAAPRLKQLGIDVVIVERLVDVVDELFRFKPDIVFVDADLPDFEKAYKTIADQAKDLPMVLTARNASSIPDLGRAGIAIRPYAIDEVVDMARAAVNDPQRLLAHQHRARPEPHPPVAPAVQETLPIESESYDIVCYNCRVVFDATEADWCSCLTRDRTVVCTNCLTCFCKAAPAYKETFWLEAPPRLFARKAAELQRQSLAIVPNPSPAEVKRPLVMLVEQDEVIQAMMQRVCANLGYGSVSATSGDEGLDVARKYHPNLILADSFLPTLDGREMCRRLKEEPAFADTKMVVMTGLYADTKFKAEGIKRFHLDDYLASPVSITDLINLLQRHLEGVLFMPAQENLHELHRKEIDGDRPRAASSYEVACATCGDMFDAAKSDWCNHDDPSLLCEHCRNCFCGAPDYRQRFWANAPAVMFERKMIRSMRDGAVTLHPPPASVKRPLILLVEEDDSMRLMVKTVASTLGYGFVATSGEDAVAMAAEYKPELILADAWMHDFDGRDVCRALKEDPGRAQMKTIVMTGRSSDAAYREETLTHFNVDDCIAKPLEAGDLLEMVKKHLPQEVRAL